MNHDPDEGLMSAAVVFDCNLVKLLNSEIVRIPTNFVGIRRLRPCKLLEETKNSGPLRDANPVFKVKLANGMDRRMTKREKKMEKYRIKQQEKEDRKRQRTDETNSQTSPNLREPIAVLPTSNRRYYQLSLSNAALEQELSELRGERNGLPPVLLSPAMAVQADNILWQLGCSTQSRPKVLFCYDHEMSKNWAKLLKQNMLPAETVRDKDDLRPMPYQLNPEPWTRLRQNIGEDTLKSTRVVQDLGSHVNLTPSKCKASRVICRRTTEIDLTASLVFEYLFKETSHYVSCGAKFGCDYLIYDGPREERHAFAGLRILQAKEWEFPMQSAFSLSGFVRCLNTAGKFALLATAIRDKSSEMPLYRLAFVDIALEKVLTAPPHKKRARTQKRRDVAKNLSKV